MNLNHQVLKLFLLFLIVAGCDNREQSGRALRLATTTSTRDSGLLDVVLPPFIESHQVRLDVIAVGTGKALKLGAAGDADVVLVHAKESEQAFMDAKHGSRREEVMFNTFLLLGPKDDPASIRDLQPARALRKIARRKFRFISRSDDSGTHKRELKLWEQRGGLTLWPDYIETGQGMGSTLIIADELHAYVLCDRGTYLNFQKKIDLVPLVANSDDLKNPYGAIVVNPAVHSDVHYRLANDLVDYLISQRAQELIRDYKIGDEPLFFPMRLQPEK